MGDLRRHAGSGAYYYDAEGSFVMNLVFHPATLQQWPGGGSLTWSQDGWSYKLAIGDTRTDPLPAPQVITVLTTQATPMS